MTSFVLIFEIPAIEISRAINFYESILDITIEKMDFPDMQMGLFPSEGQVTFGVIVQGEGYTPSPNGITIILMGEMIFKSYLIRSKKRWKNNNT